MSSKNTLITGVIIESDEPLTLEELAQAISMNDDIVIKMVEYQLIQPKGDQPKNWKFDSLCLRRAKIAASFYRDLEINLSGIALALDLLEQIDDMQSRIDTLEKLAKL